MAAGHSISACQHSHCPGPGVQPRAWMPRGYQGWVSYPAAPVGRLVSDAARGIAATYPTAPATRPGAARVAQGAGVAWDADTDGWNPLNHHPRRVFALGSAARTDHGRHQFEVLHVTRLSPMLFPVT